MKINDINSTQDFSGVKFSKKVPKEIVKAIKSNPTIKQAGKQYSLYFNIHKISGIEEILCTMSSPKIDSIFELMFTPPHTVTKKSHWFKLQDIEKLKEIPDFFEQQIGKEKKLTFYQRLVAIYESFKMSLLTNQDIKSGKAHKMITNYTDKYKPVFPKKL